LKDEKMRKSLMALEAIYTSDSIKDIEASIRQDIPDITEDPQLVTQTPVVIDIKGVNDAKQSVASTEIDNNLTNITGNGDDNEISMANEVGTMNTDSDGSNDFDFAPATEAYDNESVVVDATIDGLDNGLAALSALGELSDAAQGIQSSEKGISDSEINILRVSTEYISSQLGLTGAALVPSQESMEGVSSHQILKIVQENITDTIKKGLKAVRETLTRIWNMLVDFVLKVFRRMRTGLANALKILAEHNRQSRNRRGGFTVTVTVESENMIVMENVAKCFGMPGQNKLTPSEINNVLENCFKLDGVTKNIGQTLINNFMSLISDLKEDSNPEGVYKAFLMSSVHDKLLSHVKDLHLPYGFGISMTELEKGRMRFEEPHEPKVSGHIAITVAGEEEISNIIETIAQNVSYLHNAEDAVVRLNHLKDEVLNKLEVDLNKLSHMSNVGESRSIRLSHSAAHIAGMFFGDLAHFLKSLLHIVFLGSSIGAKYCNKCISLRNQSQV
jgi:hypothetical protein